jgi:hypothetical protein
MAQRIGAVILLRERLLPLQLRIPACDPSQPYSPLHQTLGSLRLQDTAGHSRMDHYQQYLMASPAQRRGSNAVTPRTALQHRRHLHRHSSRLRR